MRMHDNDGVGAFSYFTSIPCGNNIPRLIIGRFRDHSIYIQSNTELPANTDPAYRSD